MKSIFLFPALLLAAMAGQAQTNRIEHRSHSGSRSFTAVKTDNFGKIAPYHHLEPKRKPQAADTVKVIKVKPWKPVKDSLPPAVNPVYTRGKAAGRKPSTRSK